jgi:hypothetical protein
MWRRLHTQTYYLFLNKALGVKYACIFVDCPFIVLRKFHHTYSPANWYFASELCSSNTGDIVVQLVAQQCCIASCKALLRVLPPMYTPCHTTNFCIAIWRNLLQKVEVKSPLCNTLRQLATDKFVVWQVVYVGGKTRITIKLAQDKMQKHVD